MKSFTILIIFFFLIGCTPQVPQNSKTKLINKYPVLDIKELKKNKDSLYCLNDGADCNIIDGSVTLYANYNSFFTDNFEKPPYLYAKGEFLEGKYQGMWKYYNKKRNVIKKEKWNNGKLIYRKEFK